MNRASSNLAFDRMVACDELVAKAIGVTEISQIARSETRMREYLLAKWEELAAKALRRALALGKAGAKAKEISSAVDRIMGEWSKGVERRYLEEFTRIYYRARSAGWKKANGLIRESLTYDIPEGKAKVEKAGDRKLVQIKPFFDVVDERAVEALRAHQTFWIGSHYDEKVSAGIASTAKEWVVEAGRHPREAIGILKDRMERALGEVKVPGGYSGSAKSYFEGVVANAATVARVQGQMRSFIDYGVTTYEIVNPRDSRTCEPCVHMDGKTFSVRQGAETMEGSLAAKTPDQVKSAQPWMDIKQIQAISPEAGKAGPGDAAKLAEARFCLPPFHFKCRCTVDISEDAGSWRLAGPSEEVPPPRPPAPPPSEPPKPKFTPPPEVPKPAPQPIPTSAKRPARRGRQAPEPIAAPPGRPQFFPPMKQTPGTPNEEFNVKRLTNYLKTSKSEKNLENIVYKNGLEVRREISAICAEHKMFYRDLELYTGKKPLKSESKKRVYQLLSTTNEGKANYLGGSHATYIGALHVGTGAWDDLIDWAKKYASNPEMYGMDKGLQRKARWAFEVVLHETVHGHGPVMSQMSYIQLPTAKRKVAMMLEEVVTDSATRWMSIKKLGGTLREYEWSKFQSSVYDEGIQMFAGRISEVARKHIGANVWDGIEKAAATMEETKGVKHAAGYRALFDSAIRFKQQDATKVQTLETWYGLWADQVQLPPEALAGMTKEKATRVMNAFRKELKESYKTAQFEDKAEKIISYIKDKS